MSNENIPTPYNEDTAMNDDVHYLHVRAKATDKLSELHKDLAYAHEKLRRVLGLLSLLDKREEVNATGWNHEHLHWFGTYPMGKTFSWCIRHDVITRDECDDYFAWFYGNSDGVKKAYQGRTRHDNWCHYMLCKYVYHKTDEFKKNLEEKFAHLHAEFPGETQNLIHVETYEPYEDGDGEYYEESYRVLYDNDTCEYTLTYPEHVVLPPKDVVSFDLDDIIDAINEDRNH